MGYVPPTQNETAVKYGQRAEKERPLVQPVPPAENVSFMNFILRNERDDGRFEEHWQKLNKRREIEQEITNKGREIDAGV
ncbi:hypothetical protein [Salsuginibacillus kocurii]|uniref:hypothetical protein n=1 Tax=Salsuginibacillus kocurii TaxID=427078 RepID=UPI00036F8F0F|nr:hypothetical protein [Salsuginibacillus kocurii]